MSTDPHDELARYRARRDRERSSIPDPAHADDSPASAEQDAAIARARESWILSQLKREEAAQERPPNGE
jgi:hypothetical protein